MGSSKSKAIFVFASLIFLQTFIFAQSSGKMQLNSISPKGRQIYEEEKEKFPKFDREKYEKEAAEKYPLVKIGDKITITTKKNVYSGKFGGMKGLSTIIIDDKPLPVVDLPPEELLKYNEEENKKARDAYVKKFSEEHSAKKMQYIEELKEKIFLKYPAVDEKRLAKIFSNVSDAQKRSAYIKTYQDIYEDFLPVETTFDEMEQKIFAELFEKHPELCYVDGKIWIKEEKEAHDRRIQEAHEAKIKRIQARALMPKTSSPYYQPDGGIFDPNKEIKILCSTENAKIYYTLDGSDPDMNSIPYDTPIVLEKPIQIKAIAVHPEFKDSEVTVIAPWAGGVYVSYFEYMTFRGKTIERVEPEIDLALNHGQSIESSFPHDLFSIIWAGQIMPPQDGTYEFFLTVDDGSRFWLGDQLLIDAWKEQPPTEYSKKIKLEGGKKYDFKLTLTEVQGFVKGKLEWQSETIPRQVIPQERFFPEGKYVEELKRWNKKIIRDGQEFYVNRESMKNPGEYLGNFKLPVKGGQERWDKLGIK